jgi:dihydroorotate dehydrogenase electron transfer subunit
VIHAVAVPVVDLKHYPSQGFVFSVEAPKFAESVVPGQFVMAAPHVAGQIPYPLLKRALAVYSVEPESDPTAMGFLVKVVGEGTLRLSQLGRGDLVDLVGPLGNGFDLGRAAGKLNLLVVGGTGIASVLMLARSLVRRGEEVRLIYGGRTVDDLIGLEDFTQLEITILTTTEDGTSGLPGLVTDGLREVLEQVPQHLLNVYTCGPNAMMQAVCSITNRLSIDCQLSIEVKMACGFGVCLGCTVKTQSGYQLACSSGPVFDAREFVWEENQEVLSAS